MPIGRRVDLHLLNQFRRLRIRNEKRADIHEAFRKPSLPRPDRMCGGLTEQRKSLIGAVQIPAFQPLTQDELV